MLVQVNSYSGTSLQTTAKRAAGSGTKSSWVISLTSFPYSSLEGAARTVVHTGSGHGSSSTTIRRFSVSLTDTLGAYDDSPTLGAVFTIPTDGIYSVTYTDVGGSATPFGVSLNSSELTTAFGSITQADKLLIHGSATSGSCSGTFYFTSGDVLRCHTDGSMTDNAIVQFTLERLF